VLWPGVCCKPVLCPKLLPEWIKLVFGTGDNLEYLVRELGYLKKVFFFLNFVSDAGFPILGHLRDDLINPVKMFIRTYVRTSVRTSTIKLNAANGFC